MRTSSEDHPHSSKPDNHNFPDEESAVSMTGRSSCNDDGSRLGFRPSVRAIAEERPITPDDIQPRHGKGYGWNEE